MKMDNIDKFNKAMQEFKKHIGPAPSVLDSDDYFTTLQLYDKFTKLTLNNSIKKKDFHDTLLQNGFIYEYFLDEFVWPIKFIQVRESI